MGQPVPGGERPQRQGLGRVPGADDPDGQRRRARPQGLPPGDEGAEDDVGEGRLGGQEASEGRGRHLERHAVGGGPGRQVRALAGDHPQLADELARAVGGDHLGGAVVEADDLQPALQHHVEGPVHVAGPVEHVTGGHPPPVPNPANSARRSAPSVGVSTPAGSEADSIRGCAPGRPVVGHPPIIPDDVRPGVRNARAPAGRGPGPGRPSRPQAPADGGVVTRVVETTMSDR